MTDLTDRLDRLEAAKSMLSGVLDKLGIDWDDPSTADKVLYVPFFDILIIGSGVGITAASAAGSGAVIVFAGFLTIAAASAAYQNNPDDHVG